MAGVHAARQSQPTALGQLFSGQQARLQHITGRCRSDLGRRHRSAGEQRSSSSSLLLSSLELSDKKVYAP